jgi:DNA recombination protein RmuC
MPGWSIGLLAVLVLAAGLAAWRALRVAARLGEMEARRGQPDQSCFSCSVKSRPHGTRDRRGLPRQRRLRTEARAVLGPPCRRRWGRWGQRPAALQHVGRVVGDVQGSLGKLGETNQRIFEVGKSIAGLEQILKSPKVRGGLGETFLENLLSQMLMGHYELQHQFSTGDRVDAVVRIGDRMVSIDAKFPLENFQRMIQESEDAARKPWRRAFVLDIKARVYEIAKKYILPDEGTYDFALMYIPAENVYFEAITRDESLDEDPPGVYATSKRVIPVSPNSLYAYLQVIVLGLKGLQIERSAQEIQERLSRLGGDLEKFRDAFDLVGRHLTNARNKYDEAGSALNRVEAKLEGIEKPHDQRSLPGL